MKVYIEIDYREKDAGIAEILRSENSFAVEIKNLPIGDYIINKHVTVERKTTRDFILSIIDGRLFSQAARLRTYREKAMIIIEGTDLFVTEYKIDTQAIKGAIISLSVSWQIPLIFSGSPQDSAEILIMAGIQDTRYCNEILKRAGRKPKRMEVKNYIFYRVYRALARRWQKGCWSALEV